MSEIVNMQGQKAETTVIEEMRIENRVQIIKLFMGNSNDFIMISGNDIALINRFIEAGDELETLALDMAKKEEEIGEKEHKKMSELRMEFSQKATEITDSILGNGTTRKFFGDVYENISDFCPDIEACEDFWDAMIPVIEKLSEHKIKLEKLASRRRMGKYQPQDHKKPGSK